MLSSIFHFPYDRILYLDFRQCAHETLVLISNGGAKHLFFAVKVTVKLSFLMHIHLFERVAHTSRCENESAILYRKFYVSACVIYGVLLNGFFFFTALRKLPYKLLNKDT